MEIDRAGLEVLDRQECLRLLTQTQRGRIAIHTAALPAILPVRFVLDVNRVVLSASEGTTLARATDGSVVAFQTDGTERETEREWSVSLIGLARHLTEPDDVARAAVLPLPRWSADLPPRYIAISTDRVSGRRTLG
jgi:nitroimidazol reductase NimA-like FMN-containing flavoprotein (pyridoxamine 5'-phosphate oxidase superfamily)